ncbi:hypothetical protein CB0940_06210 [Cercospora beticola]|uniref:Uncharacterized protein n=1 Tax=Cercospora beticola TaxID=122368 RepID=A0A2G5I101_CERBT|nr:hypothetical protein CB0940_06210 [Cercospora beticola]PIA98477.1 hypothetical protein CB0940_06210 [Cercospora beticola]WPA98827.1 hypothetical protein RHO25_003440 [Cercospora beticola]CAK1360109.1 unnamed protein product [Cercospora beticola]
MCDRGPHQPFTAERCDAASEETEHPEINAKLTEKCLVLTPVSRSERRSTLGSIGSIDDEEDVRLSRDDRTDSGIDVSYTQPRLSRLCEKHGCATLLQLSTNGSHDRGNMNSLSEKLAEDWFSPLLLPFEKLNLSWPVAQCLRPQSTSASCIKPPGDPNRQLPCQHQDRITVNVGNSHGPGGSSGPYRNSSDCGRGLPHAPPEDNSGREHEPDADPNPSASNEDDMGGFPCIFHKIGTNGLDDPTPKCKWRRLYTSQLRGHHFHSSHPNGPFGCCSRCFETGRWVSAHGGLEEWRRFINKPEVVEHEKKCIRDICIDETCHNFKQGLPAFSPCLHGAKHTQQQIWKMWYRRAHSLTRNEGVPNLTNPSSQQLHLPPAVLERSQSSPGYTRAQAVSTGTPASRTNAIVPPLIADSPSSHPPTAGSATNRALSAANATREMLKRLARGLIERMQVDPSEPGEALRRSCEQKLNSSERLQYDLSATSPDDADAIELLRSLVQECLRLLTTPMTRTPAAWVELSLTALLVGIEIPLQPPASWSHPRPDFPESSTLSSLDYVGIATSSGLDSDPQQQQQQHSFPHRYQQQHPAFDMLGNPAMNAPPPAMTFSGPAAVTEMGGAFTSQAANLSSIGIDDHTAQRIRNLPDQPYHPHQRLQSSIEHQTSMHALPQNAQPPPSMDPDHLPLSTEHAYLRSRQGLAPLRLMPPASDALSASGSTHDDSGCFSTTQSTDFDMGGVDNDKGKGPATERPPGPMGFWSGI